MILDVAFAHQGRPMGIDTAMDAPGFSQMLKRFQIWFYTVNPLASKQQNMRREKFAF